MKVVSGLCLFVIALAYTSAQRDLPPAPADGSCTPGKSYKVDCNTCTCGPNGKLAACTLAFCIPPRNKREANDDLPPVPANGECEPGKAYRDDCNTCTCTKERKIGGCTYKLCPPRSKRNAVEPAECAPNDVKKKDCNTCYCENGRWACTKRECVDLSKLPRERRETPLPSLPADGTCVAGNSYQNDCNVCRCRPGNILACTEKACVSKRSADPQECSEGQTKKEDCNTCHCSNGLWGCTRKFCPEENRKRRETCDDGDSKQEDCNTCRCSKGQWACTRKICPGQNRKRRETCTNGETKKVDCNTCQCYNGNWACTLKGCSDYVRLGRDIDEQCTVGAVKKEDCNTCNCIQLQDGKTGWGCTKLACPHQDSSRSRRDVGVTSDLKNTPCAPNDFFQLDCNTCYCNSAKTGYLCTENICPPDNTTEISNSEGVESSTLSTTLGTSTIGCNTIAVSPGSTSGGSSSSTEASSSEIQASSIASTSSNSTDEQNLNSTDTVG